MAAVAAVVGMGEGRDPTGVAEDDDLGVGMDMRRTDSRIVWWIVLMKSRLASCELQQQTGSLDFCV